MWSRTGSAPTLLLDAARVIWPDAASLEITRSLRSDARIRDYVVLPSARSPHWLLPAGAPATAAALGGRDSGRAEAAARRVLATAHARRLTDRLPLQRLRVGSGGESLVTVVEHLLGDHVEVAIRLGNWSHLRSLVVRVFGPDGTTIAFGKVGIDEHGRAAVRAEAAALERVARLGLRQVRHPEVLHHDTWRGLELLVVSPLVPVGGGGGGQRPPAAAMRELARADAPREDTLANSLWMSSAQRRIEELVDPGLRGELAGARQRLAREAGEIVLPLGCWHGDWTAWNMARDASGVLLWDWEHFARDVPVGFDLVHHLAQQLRVASGVDRATEEAWRRQSADLLARHVGLGPAQRDALVVAYLLEVNLRFLLDRQSSPEQGARRSGWGLELLRRAGSDLVVE